MKLIDVTYGNISQEQADRMVTASWYHGDPLDAGVTEPWISEIVPALLKATGVPRALETGAFQGHTSCQLARAIRAMGGGVLDVCEIDGDRATRVRQALLSTDVHQHGVFWEVHEDDALSVIKSLPDRSLGLAWVDDDHTMGHVSDEVAALWSKMAPRGIIALHDVYGSCDLRKVVAAYGGFCLDLPRAGPAGGIGLIQPIR